MRNDPGPQAATGMVAVDRPARWTRRSLFVSGAAAAAGAMLSSPASAAGGRVTSAPPGAAYDSAELVVEAYLDALARAELDAATAVFAVESYVERFDFRGWLEWIGLYQGFAMPLPLPSSDPFNVAINIQHRRANVTDQVLNQYFALVNPEFDPTTAQPLADDRAVDEFATALERAMTPEVLADLTDHELVPLEEIDADAAAILREPRSTERDELLTAIVGADESSELAVRSSVGGRELYLLFRTIRYDEAWALEELGGRFANLVGIPPRSAGVAEAGPVAGPGDADSEPTTAG